MFSRSRIKIILSIMLSLVLLFAVTLSVILFASYREIRQKDGEMLRHYAEVYVPGEPAGEQEAGGTKPDGESGRRQRQKNRPMDERPDYRLSTFYAVAFSGDGSVLAADVGDKGVYEEEELTALARELVDGGKESGRTGNLSYVVDRRSDCTLVAFLDTTVTEGSLGMLLRNVLIVGGAAIVALFFIALFLSKKIIRPLEENDLRQKQFVSDASHELKTPAAVIGVNAEMLARELGENEWLANIRYENERMTDLVKQLLDLSRAENAELPAEPVDFTRTVTGEILALESLAFDQGKKIRSDVEDGIRVAGSPTQLTQLISVLLDNAIRHSTGREIDVSLKKQGHTAILCVSNEGGEIPREKLEHLFDRFYRIDQARNSEGQHYGLGLSIAKAVAERHGGRIEASCRNGRVIFTVSLPVKK